MGVMMLDTNEVAQPAKANTAAAAQRRFSGRRSATLTTSVSTDIDPSRAYTVRHEVQPVPAAVATTVADHRSSASCRSVLLQAAFVAPVTTEMVRADPRPRRRHTDEKAMSKGGGGARATRQD